MGNHSENLLFFYWKKTSEGAMGNLKRRQSTVTYILEWKNEQMFMWALWSSNYTTKVEYGLIKTETH